MKTETQTSAQSALTNTFLSTNGKYNGLLKQNLSKRVRSSLFSLITYLDSTSPHFQPLHTVITFFRFFQLLGISFFAASERFWPNGELHQKIVSYLSVFYHLIPIEYRYKASIFIEFFYIIITVLYFTLLLTSSYIYKTSSKLPKAVVILITILNGSVMLLIHPIAIQMASQETSRLIMGMKTYSSKILAIVGLVLTYFCAIVFIYIYAKTMSITLLFRPSSFITTSNIPSLFFMLATFIATFLSGITTYLSKIPYIILTILTALFMFSISYIIFLPASLIRTRDMMFVLSSSITGGISLIIIAIYAALDKKASMAILFVLIAIFVISIIASSPIINFYEKKCLKILDEIADDQNIEAHIKTPDQLIRYSCVGFKFAHPNCLDWSIFKKGSEIWHESSTIWAIFGKYVAIYPEENNLMTYIIRNIESKKLKGNFAKQTIAQGRTILMSRENSLSPQLKRKMQHIGKSVQHSKRKMRNIWDIILQGNTHEMENSINSAYNTINKTQNEYNHILSQYPNNRFIARSYARFLQEIKADNKGFQEWVEKIKLLQRGVNATVDNTNILGVETFPNIPHVLANVSDGIGIQVGESESALQLEIEIEDEQVNDQMIGIRDQINSLAIPSLRLVSICSIVIYILLIVLPVIVVFCVSEGYIDSLNKPLEFMYYLSYLRTLTNQLPSFSFHSIFEQYPDPPLFHKLDYSDFEISSLGYHDDTKDQYKFLIQELTVNLEAIGQFGAYEVNNPTIKPAIDRTFRSTNQYRFYDNDGNYTIVNLSTQSALMDYTIQLSKLSMATIDESTLNSPIVMNPLANTEMVSDMISLSIEAVISYLLEIKSNMTKTMLIVLIVLFIFFLIFYIILTIFEIIKVKANKNEIYSCLSSLPKNVVSGLAEALRVMKKDSDGTKTTEIDTEYSKQEDYILKLFASAGDSTGISADRHIFIICNIVLLAIDLLLTYILTQMFDTVTESLVENGPHLNYVLGATSYMMQAMNSLEIAAVAFTHYFNHTKTPIELLQSLNTSFSYFNYYYQRARYGGPKSTEPPFAYFTTVNAEAVETYSCKDQGAIPNSNKDIYTCFSPDQQTTLFIGMAQKISLPVLEGETDSINISEELFDDLWYVSAIYLYQSFFSPMFSTILPKLRETMDTAVPDTMPGAIILVIIGLIAVVVINIFIIIDNKKLKFALSLLLHCEPQVLMQTQKIMDVLNGHFTSKGQDKTSRNDRFFTEVVSILPDSIIVINNQMQIVSANKSTERIYSIDPSSLVGTKITDFLSSPNFSTNMSEVVEKATAVAAAVKPVQVQYKKEAGSTNYLELSCIIINQFFILTTQDVTRIFVYNTLIEEERAKSDKLLASILPPSLVVRVQKGEKNISFAVQSATILFLDIVSFTPWCASNTAQMVMSTLNNMFKLMDTKLATHQTATKIKCIGDCYMCAGGIFDEINQPNVHAREIVEFGQESIECIRQLDKDFELSLQIRVGINTGGPIVAGVLGTEKPTFEILGPAINMAQQMEHHGVPMQVHISRSVYELIYGGPFVIKERGQIEIKSGKVITYLVQTKEAQT